MLFFISNISVFQTLKTFALRFGAYIEKSKLTPLNIFIEKEIKKQPSEVSRNLARDHRTTNGRRENVGREGTK